jgi:hypothetical protein
LRNPFCGIVSGTVVDHYQLKTGQLLREHGANGLLQERCPVTGRNYDRDQISYQQKSARARDSCPLLWPIYYSGLPAV